MTLALHPIKDAVAARLSVPNVKVYVTEVPDDAVIGLNPNGTIKPYIVVNFTSPYRAARGRGIVSSRHDVNVAGCVVRCVAPTASASSQLSDKVMNLLTGWFAPDTGEFTLEGGGSSDNANGTVRPTKFFTDLAFGFRTNLTFS